MCVLVQSTSVDVYHIIEERQRRKELRWRESERGVNEGDCVLQAERVCLGDDRDRV